MRQLSSMLRVGSLAALLSACAGHSSEKAGQSDGASAAGGASGSRNTGNSAGTLTSNGMGGALSSGASGTAGTAAGGTAKGGAGGTGGKAPSAGGGVAGGVPTLPGDLPLPPANCKALSQAATTEMCTYSFECEAVALYSRCDVGQNDTWACQCATSAGGAVIKELMLRGVEGATACGVMARACLTDTPAGDRVCERTSEGATANDCQLEDSCGPSFELGSGINAHGVERRSVSCSRTNDGKFSCTCLPQLLGKQDHTVTAPSSQAACEAMIDVCRDGFPASAAPPICTDGLDTPTPTTCGVTRQCTQSAALSNGASLTSAITRYTGCYGGLEGSVDGQSICTCEGGLLASFTLQANVEIGTDACRTMLDACTGATKLEPTGPVDCKIASKNAQAHACDAKLVCTRALRLGAVDVVGQGELDFTCQQAASGGPWWCACVSKGAPKVFELGSAPSAEDVCYAAVDRCMQEVEVEFGPHPPLQTLPSPL